jgi:hypothetical protein
MMTDEGEGCWLREVVAHEVVAIGGRGAWRL